MDWEAATLAVRRTLVGTRGGVPECAEPKTARGRASERHLGPPDGSANLTPIIRGWFQNAGFAEVAFRYPAPGHGVGVHRLVVPPRPFVPGRRLFAFVARGGYPSPPPGPAGDGP